MNEMNEMKFELAFIMDLIDYAYERLAKYEDDSRNSLKNDEELNGISADVAKYRLEVDKNLAKGKDTGWEQADLKLTELEGKIEELR